MRRAPEDPERLLRWYPSAWRDRYGGELVALLEDELDGARPTVGLRMSLALAGTRQRARSGGLTGDGGDPELRVRTGALVVLTGWTLVVFGGAAFAKVSEHFGDAQPASAQSLARGAFAAVVVLAVSGDLLVLAGAALALPATLRFLRSGGWSSVRRRVLWAAVAVVGLVAATFGLAKWAHQLPVHQRNGGDLAYSVAFLAWGVLAAVTLGLVTAAGTAIARRVSLERPVLRAEGALATVVGALATALTVATGLWWAGMARGAPWFLAGTRPGTHPSPVTVPLVFVEGCLVLASAVALYGAVRTARSVSAI